MKLSEFIALPQEEKKIVVTNEGVPLAKRELYGYVIFLFHLTDCYVETWCSQQNRQVSEYRVFHNPEHLTPYLEAISIDHLLSP
jgi:hypothetical protein